MHPFKCIDETIFCSTIFIMISPKKTKIEHAIDDEMKKHHMNTSRTSLR